MSKYKAYFTGTCCCGKRKYVVLDQSRNKIVNTGRLTKKEAQDTISLIEELEGK